MKRYFLLLVISCMLLSGCHHSHHHHQHKNTSAGPSPHSNKSWLAGDHHIHSHYSVGWDKRVSPPKAKLGGDAVYSTPKNAQMAKQHGLSWMVTTDHGGPNHSKINLNQAYPELLRSRQAIPDLIQFYGLELDTPGAGHSSVIMPHSHTEATDLHDIEHQFGAREVHPHDPSRQTEAKMLEALTMMDQLAHKPVVFANHPSRTAKGLGQYGRVSPSELRNWNDTAPDVAVGMEGAPGHQASTLNEDSTLNPNKPRGGYKKYPTMGGFDQMTARLGGFWDSMLGEGRKWWITATSDSHKHYTEGRADFWPGEYSKTYVYAEKSYDGILSGLRHGNVFVTTGDLISELYLSAQISDQASAPNSVQNSVQNRNHHSAMIGETLQVKRGENVTLTVKFLDPQATNGNGQNPAVKRVDVITGLMTAKTNDRSRDSNPSTKVFNRYHAADWQPEGNYQSITVNLGRIEQNSYIRVRGTNTSELEPQPDAKGEDPWRDLWFYSNPVFINVVD